MSGLGVETEPVSTALMMSDGTLMSADESVEYGACDRLIAQDLVDGDRSGGI